MIEQVDEDFLKRNDLDEEGALYKFVQRLGETPLAGGDYSNSPALGDTLYGVEKKTRLNEDLTDLNALVAGIKQTDAALRAGQSRNTAYRIERGDPGLAIGQVLRYLDAIAPGSTLLDLLSESDPALAALAARERTQRVRDLSTTELDELDF